MSQTVPSVAPANVSGGNGRRHELVILWEVGLLCSYFSWTTMKAYVHKHNIMHIQSFSTKSCGINRKKGTLICHSYLLLLKIALQGTVMLYI